MQTLNTIKKQTYITLMEAVNTCAIDSTIDRLNEIIIASASLDMAATKRGLTMHTCVTKKKISMLTHGSRPLYIEPQMLISKKLSSLCLNLS